MRNTIRSKLVAKQDGVYKNYVFQNLDQENNSIAVNYEENDNILFLNILLLQNVQIEILQKILKLGILDIWSMNLLKLVMNILKEIVKKQNNIILQQIIYSIL